MMKNLLLPLAFVLLTGVYTMVDAQVISYFSWDIAGNNETIADIGPNGISSGANAEAQSTGNGSIQGLAPGAFTQVPSGFCCVFNCDPVCCVTPNNCGHENINLVVPNPGNIFDQPEIRFSIDYRRTDGETEAYFFTREPTSGTGPRFRMGLLFSRFKVEFSTADGNNHDLTLFNHWPGVDPHEVPNDGVWRNYAFEYVQATGQAAFYIDGALAFSAFVAPAGTAMAWPATLLSIGPNMDNEGNDLAILDNSEVSIPTPLPVTYSYLSGEQVGLRNRIDWGTVVEANSSHFNITRLDEDGDFVYLGSLEAAGTSADEHNYTFYDNNPQPGVNYYRLEQVDFNGTSSFSSVVEVRFDVNDLGLIAVYPNPVGDGKALNVKFRAGDERTLDLQVIDLQGRMVMQRTEEISTEITNMQIPTETLPTGMYIVRVVAGGQAWTKKFTKN